MFVQDMKTDFYTALVGKRVLVIVNYDIDGICASKILQALFKYDHMVYSVVPIMGRSGLQRAFAENKDDIKLVLLINCGGCIDIVEVLQPDEEVVFFVCDSHRPMDVCNIYSDSQVSTSNIVVRRARLILHLFARAHTHRFEYSATSIQTKEYHRSKVSSTSRTTTKNRSRPIRTQTNHHRRPLTASKVVRHASNGKCKSDEIVANGKTIAIKSCSTTHSTVTMAKVRRC